MLASTTPAECIQERTVSGSSFMLAVAPRGRLSWIPNISGAQMLQPLPPPPLCNQENKTTRGRVREEKQKEKRKVLQKKKKSAVQDGRRGDGLVGRPFLRQHRNALMSESSRTSRKYEEEEEEEERDLCSRNDPRVFYSTAKLWVNLSQLLTLEQHKDLLSEFILKDFFTSGRHIGTNGGGEKVERKIKSSEDEKTRGRTEPSPDGESSASKVSFFFSPKRGGERRRTGRR